MGDQPSARLPGGRRRGPALLSVPPVHGGAVLVARRAAPRDPGADRQDPDAPAPARAGPGPTAVAGGGGPAKAAEARHADDGRAARGGGPLPRVEGGQGGSVGHRGGGGSR